jgi:hypothetical protein
MKDIKWLKNLSLIYGIIVTSLMLLALGSKILIKISEEGFEYLIEIPKAFVSWEDPTALFFTYIIGYVIVWWKPLWGSIIIILASIFYVIIAGFDGPPIFATPTFLVGLFYLLYWNIIRKNKINVD